MIQEIKQSLDKKQFKVKPIKAVHQQAKLLIILTIVACFRVDRLDSLVLLVQGRYN